MVPIILSTCGTNCSVASSSTFPHGETTEECAYKLQVRHRGTTYLPDAMHPILGEQNFVPESKLKINWDTCVESFANHSLRHAIALCGRSLSGTTFHRKMAQEKRLYVRSVGASNFTSRSLQVQRLQKRKLVGTKSLQNKLQSRANPPRRLPTTKPVSKKLATMPQRGPTTKPRSNTRNSASKKHDKETKL